MWPHIHVQSSDTVVPVLSVPFTPFWIVADDSSVDNTEDSREVDVEVVVIGVVDESVVTAVDDAAARGLPHTTLRLLYKPSKIMKSWKKYFIFISPNITNFSNAET